VEETQKNARCSPNQTFGYVLLRYAALQQARKKGATMSWRELDDDVRQYVPRRDQPGVDPRPTEVDFPARQFPSQAKNLAAALEMVSEAASAFRQLKKEAAEAVARAHNIVDAVAEKLEAANVRAEFAENAQRKAEVEANELNSVILATRNDVETLRKQLSDKEAELGAMQQRLDQAEWRADEAERRAGEAEAAIERIIESIRTQLPPHAARDQPRINYAPLASAS
jgi:DNA repair exonuclease SbcCD ATPase subunit